MRALPVLLAAAVAAGGCTGGAVTSFRLQHDAASLRSLAADGALTARGAADGRATTAFVHAHAAELAAEAGQLADVLDAAQPQPELRAESARLIRLSRRVSALLGQLADDPGDRALARRVRAGCAEAAERAESLEERA